MSCVGDRPGDLPAVALGGLEIDVRVAQADAAPDVRLAAVSPDAREREGPSVGREVRLLLRVEEERLGASRRAPAAFPRLPRRHVRPVLRAVELRRRRRAAATSMPWRVRFQAAMPPDAPLPMTMTG